MTIETLAGGRYAIEERLGGGGMAVVYRARDRDLDRVVAVKLLADHRGTDPEFHERFVREARLAARLSHPNIVTIFDSGEDNARQFIVMECVEGVTLADVLQRRGRLPVAEAIELALQACAGLEHAHAQGLVHRDVKPQNLLLREDGLLKIADFGIARTTEGTELTQAGTILGTAAYLSPEQAAGEPVTAATDIYALGAVLYELIAGRPPFEARTLPELVAQQRIARVKSLSSFAPDVPRELDGLVARCLSPEPSARPPSAAALAQELAPLTPEPVTVPLAGAAATQATAVARPRSVRVARSRTRIALVSAGAIAALALVVGILASGGDEATEQRSPPAADRVEPAADPAARARNLADWIREHSAGPGS